MSEGSKPDVFHSDDINSEFLDDLPQPIAPTSGLERAATNISRKEPRLYTPLQKFRHAYREPLAEFLGTLILVLFGDGVCAQVKLSSGSAGNYTTIAFGWATAVFLGYCVSAGVSGAHLNPAVTLAAATFRKFPWRKLPGYWFAQLLGGYCGALIMYGIYYQAFNDFEGPGIRTVTGDTASAGIFCTFAQDFLSTKGQVTSEIITTATLQIGIFAMTDPYNAGLGNLFPFGLWLLIFGIGVSYGYLTGYAINFARDFGPRLAAASVGYGSELWTYGHHYFWVPLVCPLIGSLTGAFIYDFFVYQGHDSPLNQADFGISETAENIRSFRLQDLKPDFDIERHEAERQA